MGFEEYTNTSGVGSGTERAMFADRQGSVIWVTEPATGQVVAGYEYFGYGVPKQVQGTLSQPYGYTGREHDAESGLYHYRARAYDPAAGVFVQVDPIGFNGNSLNIYGYVGGNTFNDEDPIGLSQGTGSLALIAGSATLSGDAVATIGTGLINGSLWQILKNMALVGAIGTVLNSDSHPDESPDEAKRRRIEECHKMGDDLAEEAAKAWSACVMAANVAGTKNTKMKLLKRCDEWAATRNSEIMDKVAECIKNAR